jgi:hypothetical protein
MAKEQLTQQQKDEKLDRKLRIIAGMMTVFVGIATTIMKVVESEDMLRRRRARKSKGRKPRGKAPLALKAPPKRKVGRLQDISIKYLQSLNKKVNRLNERAQKLIKAWEKEHEDPDMGARVGNWVHLPRDPGQRRQLNRLRKKWEFHEAEDKI